MMLMISLLLGATIGSGRAQYPYYYNNYQQQPQWQPQRQMQWRPPQRYPQYTYYQQQPIYRGRPQRPEDGFQPVRMGFPAQVVESYNAVPQDRRNYNPYAMERRPNRYRYQNDPAYIDPRYLPRARVDCQPKKCYFNCRMHLLGGGRCAGDAGCLCYANFFDSDGSPMNRLYPEDDFWFTLSTESQQRINTEIARHRAENQQPSRPDFNGNNNGGSNGNNGGSIGGGGFNPNIRTTKRPATGRPTYRPTSKPNYNDDNDFDWDSSGSGTYDDNEYEDDDDEWSDWGRKR